MKLKCIILLLLFVTIAASADKQLLKKDNLALEALEHFQKARDLLSLSERITPGQRR